MQVRPQNTLKPLWLVSLFACGLLGWSWVSDSGNGAWANQPLGVADGSALVSHVLHEDGRPTRVIVIDSQRRVLAVYEISKEKGEIKFLSSRNLSFDLQMLGYNTVDPKPEEIKRNLERQN